MQRKNILWVLVFGLMFVSVELFSANLQGRFNINEGDWFDISYHVPINCSDNDSSGVRFFNGISLSELNLLVRYQLEEQLENGNQIYNVTLKRVQSKMPTTYNPGIILGFDSYYPNFHKYPIKKKIFKFSMEVNPEGRIIQLELNDGPILWNRPLTPRENTRIGYSKNIELKPIVLKTLSSMMVYLPSKSGTDSLKLPNYEHAVKIQTKEYTETAQFCVYNFKINDSIVSEKVLLKKEGIPFKGDGFMMVDASFPVPANTLIKGKLDIWPNQDITISLKGDKESNYFKEQHFTTNNDGSFNCPIFLKRPLLLNIQIGNKEINSFIEPNDTLEIFDLVSKIKRVDTTGYIYDQPEKPGYMLNAKHFSGKAAINARLSFEMDEWLDYPPLPKDVPAYLEYQKTITGNVNQLLEHYKGKASANCIDYFRSRFKYYLAGDKLYFLEARQLVRYYHKPVGLDEIDEKSLSIPSDFLLEVDTLPVLMYPYDWCPFYRGYIEYAIEYKKIRSELVIGGYYQDFYSDYYFARSSLRGFPLYNALYKILDSEIRKGRFVAISIESFYNDFIFNCDDPQFIKPLKEVYEIYLKMDKDKTFPVQRFILSDSSIFNISKLNGKPVCLFVMRTEKKWISYFEEEIYKFKPDEVEFVFVFPPINYSNQSLSDSAILARSNVTVLDVMEQDKSFKLLELYGRNRIFTLDKWHRIVNDISLDTIHIGNGLIEDFIQKAIQTKRFTREQKASVYKTIGWSLGSILFTLLIGLWIYRVRMRKLKKQEAIKHQIKELEIKAIRSQMNPHFVFNALNSIQSLVNGNQYKEANIYLSKFSVLLRGVLNNSEKGMINLSEELEAVKLYCQLEQLRFEFEYDIEVDNEINSDLIEIPGMIVQPLAENAVVHGLSALGKKGKLNIKVAKCEGGLCIKVSDNGVGLKQNKEDKLSEKGYGLKLVRERIAILGYENKQAKLMVENNDNEGGTAATLVIPID